MNSFQIDLYKNNLLFWYHLNKYREIYEDRMSHSSIMNSPLQYIPPLPHALTSN